LGADILELTRFIDWIMVLPQELEERCAATVEEFQDVLVSVNMPVIG